MAPPTPGRSGAMRIGALLTGLCVAAALVSLIWTPHPVEGVDIPARLQPPGGAFALGTDQFGRDILSMLMIGARTSLAVALIAVGIGMAAGVPLGLLAAARRGGRVAGLVL
ncbi:MAG: ABC transporter permease, partial [Gemmobacter sp.]